jgi:hypothetical protein
MGWSPGSAALIPDILAQEEGLAILDGILAGAGEVADGLVLDRRDIDRRQITGTHQAGQLGRVASIGFDAAIGFLRDE